MSIDSEKDLIALQRIGKIVALAREEMIRCIKPGITTAELDAIGERVLAAYGAAPAPRKEYNFPGATCISINDVVAHGIPGATMIRQGDLINVDVSAELDGYYADTGATVIAEEPTAILKNLCDCSKTALLKGIEQAKAGAKINQIGRAIHNEARSKAFTVIKNLSGHGIGRKLHESPNHIPNYYDKHDKRLLTAGLVLAIETFVSTGAEYVVEEEDGWTLRTPDKSFVAQYEHTVVVTKEKPIILTA